MARLIIKNDGIQSQTLELRLGVNHIGRDVECDFTIDHPSVSALHCDVVLTNEGVMVRDRGSTNGTFINGEAVTEAWLRAGQTLQMGQVELLVENTDAIIAIPEYERDRPRPPIMGADGVPLCPRHTQVPVAYKCTHCAEVMCGRCVRLLRHKGGAPLFLCPYCSHKCERIGGNEKVKSKSILETVKMRLVHLASQFRMKK
ncbi:MAG: FHA domain-containing protein [Verrucomicrobiota bacterium]|jgi:DNA-directed RNA polymerase subunit RPC12/RpoP